MEHKGFNTCEYSFLRTGFLTSMFAASTIALQLDFYILVMFASLVVLFEFFSSLDCSIRQRKEAYSIYKLLSKDREHFTETVRNFYRNRGLKGDSLEKVVWEVSVNKEALFQSAIDITSFFQVNKETSPIVKVSLSFLGACLGIVSWVVAAPMDGNYAIAFPFLAYLMSSGIWVFLTKGSINESWIYKIVASASFIYLLNIHNM